MELKEKLPAIDMLMHHAGKSFTEACEELGVDACLAQKEIDAELVEYVVNRERSR